MVLKFMIFVTFLALPQVQCATNYCDRSLCGSSKHIACNNNGKFASTCRNAAMVTLTQAQKNLIVNAHNAKRNTVAGGGTKLKRACRMATMQWDNELANLASLNVRQCQMKHDACRNTKTFKYSGQNLAWMSYYGAPDVSKMIQNLINLWYNEIKDTTMAQINKYPSNYRGRPIGHFTVMVAEGNYRVGCGISTYAVAGKPYRALLLACNYARTNLIGSPIYNSCATAASGCRKGKNPAFTNLCSTSEIY